MNKTAPSQSAPTMGLPDVRIAKAGKRYYLDFYELLPSGKKKRKRLYVGNRIKDPKKKKKALEEARLAVLADLSQGRMPERKPIPFEDNAKIGVSALIDKIVKRKGKYLKTPSYSTLKTHLTGKHGISRWLSRKGYGHLPVPEIKKLHIISYQEYLLDQKQSNRTVNNYLESVSTLFNYIMDNYEDLITKNPCKGLRSLPSQSETHLAYSDEEARKIIKWLTENDSYLHFYCKFIVYAFMRPKEIRAIRLKHFDLEHSRIVMPARSMKTSRPGIIYLPKVFCDQLKKMLPKGEPDDFLFTYREKPGIRMAHDNFFPRRFAIMKKKLGFTAKHTSYGLRHTYVSQLIRNGEDDHVIMKYTRHTTMDAYEKYKRSLMAEAPKDISKRYSVKF